MSGHEVKIHLLLWLLVLAIGWGAWVFYHTGLGIGGPWLAWLCVIVWSYHCLRRLLL